MSQVSRRAYLSRSVLAVVGFVGLSGCSGAPEANSGTTETDGETPTATVSVGPDGEFVFTPGTDEPLTITAGTEVTFVWESDNHNIVVGNQPEGANWEGTPGDESELYDEGYTYEHTFDVPGEYHYWCEPHKSVGMIADIVVEA
ncbi:plasmid stabilization protein [Halogeometricum borinquense]|uniref:Plasmid stabilization protein n=1 Tax=Halogeometricum borinquense TaxID=60847 RepID=A0A6C0UIM3_9EURY|nr:plastocyanin/azurin family copper-binding protein [Halogeometricum borinquense]QIB75070.1 plasmid stabilization protein [Halogeometricum borinquense]QIQ75949.1 plasmid stabilization protein [Halogeometricum borinquense]